MVCLSVRNHDVAFDASFFEDTVFNRERMEGAAPESELKERVIGGGVQFIFGKDAIWMSPLNQDCVVQIDRKSLTHGAVKLVAGNEYKLKIAHIEFDLEVIDENAE